MVMAGMGSEVPSSIINYQYQTKWMKGTMFKDVMSHDFSPEHASNVGGAGYTAQSKTCIVSTCARHRHMYAK